MNFLRMETILSPLDIVFMLEGSNCMLKYRVFEKGSLVQGSVSQRWWPVKNHLRHLKKNYPCLVPIPGILTNNKFWVGIRDPHLVLKSPQNHWHSG